MQFTRPVIDSIVGLACAPVHGLSVDFTDATYTQANAIVKAAVYGHCSFAEASAVLSERLDAATDSLVVEKIRGAMDTLKSASACKKLKPDGTCVFAHRCNQFVSDKGPSGYCFGAHARCTGCNYDAGKKLRAPAA